MFDNLVESGSHKEDMSRKGSFLLATLAIYAVLGWLMSWAASCVSMLLWIVRILS